jgi:hypothetical protein
MMGNTSYELEQALVEPLTNKWNVSHGTRFHKFLGGMGPITLVPQYITSIGGLFRLPSVSNWKAKFVCSSSNSAGIPPSF